MLPKSSRDELEDVEKILSPLSNFKGYRNILKKQLKDLAFGLIPRVDVILRDLTHISENKSVVSGLVQVPKHFYYSERTIITVVLMHRTNYIT